MPCPVLKSTLSWKAIWHCYDDLHWALIRWQFVVVRYPITLVTIVFCYIGLLENSIVQWWEVLKRNSVTMQILLLLEKVIVKSGIILLLLPVPLLFSYNCCCYWCLILHIEEWWEGGIAIVIGRGCSTVDYSVEEIVLQYMMILLYEHSFIPSSMMILLLLRYW